MLIDLRCLVDVVGINVLGDFKSWVSHLTNKIIHMKPICPCWRSFPNLLPCPCVMMLAFHIFPPLLTPTVWETQNPTTWYSFPFSWRWRGSMLFFPQSQQRIHSHQRFMNLSNSIVYFIRNRNKSHPKIILVRFFFQKSVPRGCIFIPK